MTRVPMMIQMPQVLLDHARAGQDIYALMFTARQQPTFEAVKRIIDQHRSAAQDGEPATED